MPPRPDDATKKEAADAKIESNDNKQNNDKDSIKDKNDTEKGEQKKSHKGLIIGGIATLAAAAVIVAGAYFATNKTSNKGPEHDQSSSVPAPEHKSNEQPQANTNTNKQANKSEKEQEGQQGLSASQIARDLGYKDLEEAIARDPDKVGEYIQTWTMEHGYENEVNE